jgi:hypothetical protein
MIWFLCFVCKEKNIGATIWCQKTRGGNYVQNRNSMHVCIHSLCLCYMSAKRHAMQSLIAPLQSGRDRSLPIFLRPRKHLDNRTIDTMPFRLSSWFKEETCIGCISWPIASNQSTNCSTQLNSPGNVHCSSSKVFKHWVLSHREPLADWRTFWSSGPHGKSRSLSLNCSLDVSAGRLLCDRLFSDLRAFGPQKNIE